MRSDDSHQPPWWRTADHGRRLAGKRTIITGAGTDPMGSVPGIGEAIAILFAAQGARVTIADISHDRTLATMSLIIELGGEAVVAVGDLAQSVDNGRCVQEAVVAFDGLDIVVNNVALPTGGGSPRTSTSTSGTA